MRITTSVTTQLECALSFMHARRRAAVVAAVSGLVSGAVATLSAMGRALGSRREKHDIKRMDRLFGNSRLHAELDWVYQGVVEQVVRSQRRPTILVDWTDLVHDYVALRAAVALQGRAVPIFATVHPKKSLGNFRVQRRFLKRLRALFPDDYPADVVTDAGFRTPWFIEVQNQGWDFVGRLHGGTQLYSRRQHKWLRIKELFARAPSTPRRWGRYPMRKGRSFEAYLVAYDGRSARARKRKRRSKRYGPMAATKCARRARQPWMLVTSRSQSARRIVELYRRRMQVEESFRDDKNHRWGWGLERCGTKHRKRLEVLLALLALASLVVLLVGWVAEQQGLHRHYQANTADRRVLSLHFLGRRVLSHPPPDFSLSSNDLNRFRAAVGAPP